MKKKWRGCGEVSIMSVFLSHGSVIILSFGSFLSVDSSYKPYHYSLPISISEHARFKNFSIIRGRGNKNTLIQRMRRSVMRSRRRK